MLGDVFALVVQNHECLDRRTQVEGELLLIGAPEVDAVSHAEGVGQRFLRQLGGLDLLRLLVGVARGRHRDAAQRAADRDQREEPQNQASRRGLELTPGNFQLAQRGGVAPQTNALGR